MTDHFENVYERVQENQIFSNFIVVVQFEEIHIHIHSFII